MYTLDLSKVKVTKQEQEKLAERASNWDKLHADLKKRPPTTETLVKLLKVETMTRKRPALALRLLGMYSAQVRRENEAIVLKALR